MRARPWAIRGVAVGVVLAGVVSTPASWNPHARAGDAGAGGAAAPADARDPDPGRARALIVPGETLVYGVRVWKGFEVVGVEAGEATLQTSLTVAGADALYAFSARGVGGAFGYEIDSSIRSEVRIDDLGSTGYRYEQRGFKFRTTTIDFAPESYETNKKKHCITEGCRNSQHMIRVERGWFWTEEVVEHCEEDDGDDCLDESHYVFRSKREIPLVEIPREGAPVFDPLSAIFGARGLRLEPDGEPEEIRIATRRRLYDVTVRAAETSTITVPAGTFETVRIVLTPRKTVDDGRTSKKFRGLFGMAGDTEIWVDQKTKVPIRIEGRIPMGLELNARVDLLRRTVPQAAAGAAKKTD